MPQLDCIYYAFQRYIETLRTFARLLYAAGILDPQHLAYLAYPIHYITALCFSNLLWYLNLDIIQFAWLAMTAFYASGSFVLLFSVVEYVERRHEVNSIRDLKTVGALAWLHYELYKVLAQPLLAIPSLRRRLEWFEQEYLCHHRAALLDLLVTPEDIWLGDRHGWVRDMLLVDLDDGRRVAVPLPNLASLALCVAGLVQGTMHQLQRTQRLKALWEEELSRLRDRLRGLEEKESALNRRVDTLVADVSRCEQHIALADARSRTIRERFLSISRVYHGLVWRRMVNLKTQLSWATQDSAATRERLSLLIGEHDALEASYRAALEENEELLLELGDQDDQLRKAEDETAEWQCISEGVCFSHAKMSSEFTAFKANMYETVYCLLTGLFVIWRFSMALKAKAIARAHSDREEILVLRRRLILVEHARISAVEDSATWRSLYEESEAALQDLVDLYAQQRATYLAQSRQLLTGLLILWRYSQILGQELLDARFRMYMCPVSCEQSRLDPPVLPALPPMRGFSAPVDTSEDIDESGLSAEQILSLRFSRSNVAYASLSVQYEQLQTELEDVCDEIEEERKEHKAEQEKLESDLADACKAAEDLRTENKAETDKLRHELEEARKTIETLRTAKDAAELILQNKRNEMVLARVTVQQMRAEVEQTKRNLENRVIEWSELAAGAGRPLLLSAPRDDDDLRRHVVPHASGQSDEEEDIVLLHRNLSPPMLMERRERPLLLDPSEIVAETPASSAAIERKLSNTGGSPPSSSAAAPISQGSAACRPPLSHGSPSVLAMPGAFDFPDRPVPFRPSIDLYSGSSRRVRPIAQPRPMSSQQSLNLFARPRSPTPVIAATPPSCDASPVASDRSSSPEPGFYTPDLATSEF